MSEFANWFCEYAKPIGLSLGLARRDADIAMRILQPAPGDLVARKLGEPEEIPLASPKYAKQLGTLRTVEAALPPAPRGALWLVGHRALRNVPRIAAVWSFIEKVAERLSS